MVKTRKLNGERFHLQLETGIKDNAERFAERARKQGFRVRIIKQEWRIKGTATKRRIWKVYTRSKE